MSKTILSMALTMFLGSAGITLAQSNQDLTSRPANTQNSAKNHQSNFRGQVTQVSNKVEKASDIIGLNVKSHQDDTIGEVNDLVLNSTTGEVEYAAISVGGFLGIGDKLIAVPWRSLQCTENTEGEVQLNMHTTKEQLEKAPGFDQDNWPDFANRKWTEENDRHYQNSANTTTRTVPSGR